jgi:3-oxoacyl-ACP reductase-like protein
MTNLQEFGMSLLWLFGVAAPREFEKKSIQEWADNIIKELEKNTEANIPRPISSPQYAVAFHDGWIQARNDILKLLRGS